MSDSSVTMNLAGDPTGVATTSLCRVCKIGLPARHVERDGSVYLIKTCPEHGPQETRVAGDAAWWRATLAEGAQTTAPTPRTPLAAGCPFDCGPCPQHQARLALPILPITASCNLDCPICYTHNSNAWHMDEASLDAVLHHLAIAAPERRILNITGGEPTLHPRLIAVLERCAAEGIHRVTLSTHGLRLAHDEKLLEALARLDVRVILSFDSFDEASNQAMLGGSFGEAKLRALANLERWGVNTSLLPVIAAGHNHHEIGLFVAWMLEHQNVRSLELHPMTFTGQGGANFARRARMTADEVVRATAAQCGLTMADFVPSPLAHPLCYQCCYLLQLDDGRWLSFTRFMRRDQLRALLSDGLYIEPGPKLEAVFQEVIEGLWSGEIDCAEADAVLATLKRLLTDLFRPGATERERITRAEQATRAIYVHTHMDEESFDTDRVRLCPVGIREPDGRNVPSCSYNVLYRERDPRFVAHPGPLPASGGRVW